MAKVRLSERKAKFIWAFRSRVLFYISYRVRYFLVVTEPSA